MKQFFCLLLCTVLLLPLLTSCTATLTPTEVKTTAEKKTEESKKESYDYPEVYDKLSLKKINSFPTASSNMSEDELRQLCVDFFDFCQSFAWTPSEDYTYTVRNKKSDVTLKRGTVYGGLPYVTGARGNIYRLMEFYDEETGVVDIKKAGADPLKFGNQCSFGAFWAWARVINSATFNGTSQMVSKNGFIPVGTYSYDLSLEEFGTPNTQEICAKNGEQVMYSSYAALKPADGLVYSLNAGHVIMCSSNPVVVKNTDGSIDGEKSYFTYIHQSTAWTASKQSDGSAFRAQTIPHSKKTFAETFKENYLPFTFAELTGEDPVECSETSFSHTKDTMTVAELQKAVIQSNYAISHATFTITNENNSVVLTKTVLCDKVDQKSFTFASGYLPADLKNHAKKNRAITVTCRISTGEELTVYEGILAP